jgi:uncharacterized membrane protein YdbT with pleckstrin-like domain
MIEIDKPYKLGTKTLWLNILEQGIPAIFLFFIMIVFGICLLVGSQTLLGSFHFTAAQYAATDNFLSLATLFIIFLFIITTAYAVIFSWLSHKTHTFTMTDHALEIQQGILSRQEMSIPYRQIQDVDVNQSFLYRMIGVCRLVILTAGHEDMDDEDRDHSEGLFVLMDRDLAFLLHDELMKRANVQEMTEFKEKTVSAENPTETS